jgi:hypothetical protein
MWLYSLTSIRADQHQLPERQQVRKLCGLLAINRDTHNSIGGIEASDAVSVVRLH